jgi:DNA repair photolyase
MEKFGIYYKEMDNRKYNTWCKYTKRLDTYGCGCEHDCHYCYAKSLLEFRNNWKPKNVGKSFITEIIRVVEGLEKTDVVRLGGMTDCFQPIERHARITFETIKILNQYRINYLITTKGAMVADEEYMRIYDKQFAHFQISISTTSDVSAVGYENSSLPSARIAAIEKLQDAGFDVSLRLSPFLFKDPGFSLKVINRIKCDKVLIEFLKVNHWTRKNFKYDYSEYVLKYGGHDNLPLEKKVSMVSMVDGFKQVTVGEYVKDHHEYFRDNVNYNKIDCCNLFLNFDASCFEGRQISLIKSGGLP